MLARTVRAAALVASVMVGATMAAPGCSVPELDLTGKRCPCLDGWTCDVKAGCRRGTGGVVVVSNLRPAWTTANGVRWEWDVAGETGRFAAYELVTGPSRDDVSLRTDRAVVWSAARAPELAIVNAGKPVSAAVTDEHAMGADVYAQLTARDMAGKTTQSEIAQARTITAGAGSAIFSDAALPQGAYVQPPWYTRSTERPHAGTHCFAGRATCDPGPEVCFDNLKFGMIKALVPSPSRAAFDTRAFLEFAVAVEGGVGVPVGELWVAFGDPKGCVRPAGCEMRYRGLALRGDDRYRLVQIPLRVLKDMADKPLVYDDLAAWRDLPSDERSALKVSEFNLGARWPRGALVRIDEVRLRY